MIVLLVFIGSQTKKMSPTGLDSNCVSDEPKTIEEYLAHYKDWVYLDEFQYSEEKPLFFQGTIHTENILMPMTCNIIDYTVEDEDACGEEDGIPIEFVLGENEIVYLNPCFAERYNTVYTPLTQREQSDSVNYISNGYKVLYDNVFDCRLDEGEMLLSSIESMYYDSTNDFYNSYTYALRFPIYNQIEETLIHNCEDAIEYTLESTQNTILEIDVKNGRSIYVSNDLFYYWCNDGDSINKDSLVFSSPNKQLLDKYFDSFINCQEEGINGETDVDDTNYTLYYIIGGILFFVLIFFR